MKATKFEKYMGIGLMVVGAVGVALVIKLVMDNNKKIEEAKQMASN